MGLLKLGMVGGGQGAFIGGVHRMAARLDGRWELVAGSFSSEPVRAHASATEIGVSADRSYGDFREMARVEAMREDGIDAVSIVTPNHLHAPIAQAFLSAGIHVICDKPMTATLEQATNLVKVAKSSKASFFLTHNYTGYPMIRQAKKMVTDGLLGDLRIVQANYLQDWLSEPQGASNKQAAWRTDATQSGAGAIGDIGTHAYNLASFVTGLRALSVSAGLRSHQANMTVDDDARVALELENGARGQIWASQVAIGNENNLSLEVYGTKASLRWSQEAANVLIFTEIGKAPQFYTRGGAMTGPEAAAVTRVPAGHPEGYLEAFATIYREAADEIN
ncbi:MAG: Gfo/Idh/MocA family oxidoreductase, partial [Paracoccaceae bacterium]|nr:Gfo/Idh/MocA family oxidoreductase [Paracoccaceae bacterium]